MLQFVRRREAAPVPAVARQAGPAAGQVTLTAQGQTATVYLATAFITGPLLTATVQLDDVGHPLDKSLETKLFAAAAKRAAAA